MSSKGRFTRVKVFSAIVPKERDALGEQVGRFLAENPALEVVDKAVAQSSDKEFHCLSITLFLAPRGASKAGPDPKAAQGAEHDDE